MKRILAALLCLMLALTLVPAPAAQAAYGTATVTGGWLVLRASPSFDAQIIASYYTGTVVTVIGITGSWYQVTTPDNNIGYMYSAYLVTGSGPSPSPVTPVTPTTSTRAYVYASNGGNVRLRSGPGQSYGIIGSYRVGTQVTILNPGTYWHYISVGVQTGYMMAKYLVSTYPHGGSVYPNGGMVPTGGTTAYVYAANGKPVRLRSGPGTKYSILTAYNVGTQVTVLQRGSTWSYIRVGTVEGYMMTRYLTASGPINPINPINDNIVRSVALNTVSPSVGTVLTCAISPTSVSVSYQWMNDLGQMLGYSSNYQVQASDYGRRIRVQVYGTNGTQGSAVSSYTNPVGSTWPITLPTTVPVIPTVPPVVTAPPISSTALTSVTLSSSAPIAGTVISAQAIPYGATAHYIWYRDSVAVGSGATFATSAADVGHTLMVVATGSGLYTGMASAVVNVQPGFSTSHGIDTTSYYPLPSSSDSSGFSTSTDTGAGNVGGGTVYWPSGF